MKLKFFVTAKKMSHMSNHAKANIGAVIVKNSKLVGMGFNKLKTHPRSNHPWKHIHAELDSILNSNTCTKGADLYLYRENKQGQLAMCKPCAFCQILLAQAGIRRIYFTTENGLEKMKL